MDLTLPNTFRILAITSAYDRFWDSSFRFAGESHSMWETVCVVDGQVEVSEDEKIYQLGPGDYICHGSMEFHRIRSAGGTSPHVLTMSFSHEGALPPSLLDGVFHLNAPELEAYKILFSDIHSFFNGYRADCYFGTELAFSLGRFLIQLSRKRPNSGGRCRSRAAAEYQLLIETMHAALCENISLPELSMRTGISVSAMKNLFQKYAGIGPKAYYVHLRGLEAKRRLEGGQQIQNIAEQLNYSSPNYFCLCFKKQFGTTPSLWRRQLEDNAE